MKKIISIKEPNNSAEKSMIGFSIINAIIHIVTVIASTRLFIADVQSPKNEFLGDRFLHFGQIAPNGKNLFLHIISNFCE